MTDEKRTVLLAYVPVIHAGYLKLFETYKGQADTLCIVGDDLAAEFLKVKKEIRALPPETAKAIISHLALFPRVQVLSAGNVRELENADIVAVDDEVCRACVEKYLPRANVRYETAFLRWDSKNVKSSSDVQYSRVSEDPFDQKMIAEAKAEAEKSSDWWRHVGAVVVKPARQDDSGRSARMNRSDGSGGDGRIIARAHNHHIPTEHLPYLQGDPRDVVDPGTLNLAYTSIHAEQTIVAEAARKGLSLEGGHMYINIFPCPLCAKIMAAAGIKKCFFAKGSAWLDAETVLESHGVEIVLVK